MKNREVEKASGRKAEVWIQIMALQLNNIVTQSKLPVSLCPGSLSVKRRQITETVNIVKIEFKCQKVHSRMLCMFYVPDKWWS